MSIEINALLRGPKAYGAARRAIELMETHGVWPTTLNFELFVHYVADEDGPVAREIDACLATGEPFTEQTGEQIAARHLPATQLTGRILDAGASLTAELASVSRAIESARETSEAYGQQLASASENLNGDDAGSVRSIVQTLSAATLKVRAENEALESKLADTTDELGKLRLHLEQVRRDAMTDSLTGIANRKAFDEALDRTCAEAAATGGAIALAVVDIDHFKKFNDTWGHQTGDQVIRYVASVLDRHATKARVAARYGGEEFAVIFPGETAAQALPALEAVRQEICSRILKRRSTSDDLGVITISGGLAQLRPGESATSLLERADGALYVSKRNGRNRSTLAEANSDTRAA